MIQQPRARVQNGWKATPFSVQVSNEVMIGVVNRELCTMLDYSLVLFESDEKLQPSVQYLMCNVHAPWYVKHRCNKRWLLTPQVQSAQLKTAFGFWFSCWKSNMGNSWLSSCKAININGCCSAHYSSGNHEKCPKKPWQTLSKCSASLKNWHFITKPMQFVYHPIKHQSSQILTLDGTIIINLARWTIHDVESGLSESTGWRQRRSYLLVIVKFWLKWHYLTESTPQ